MELLRYKLFVTNKDTLKTKTLMESFLNDYDLKPYLFTKSIKIKPGVIPHSHPMLTLNTFWNASPNHLLSTFLHEQIHWFINWHQSNYGAVHRTLLQWYPKLPKDKTLIASNTFSTYLHLAVCWLEYKGLQRYLGKETAIHTLQTFPHYRWIFQTVIEDEARVGKLMLTHNLII